MISEFVQWIRSHFLPQEQGLVSLLLLVGGSFFSLRLLQIALLLAGQAQVYTALIQALSLPSPWGAYLHQPWSLLTHTWIHTSFTTTLWGLLLLYTLGRVVVNLLSSRHLVALYLLGGLVGGSFFLLLYQVSPHLQSTPTRLFGLGGSLYAVLAAAATLAPQLSFSFLLFGPIQLKHIVGFLVLLSLFDLSGTDPATSIAQLGGALLGYSYVKQVYGYAGLRQRWARFWRVRRAWKVTHRVPAAGPEQKPEALVTQAQLDEILDKVAASGYESLTPTEKQQLFEAGHK
ncbi:MAG: rhomboid family intramembrane serine protease [Bacteroidota bacterium]